MTSETRETPPDTLAELHAKVDRIVAFIERWEPHLERFGDPGQAIRDYLSARKARRG